MGRRKLEGFTLIEMLVTIFVLSIVLTMGVPSFQEFTQNNRMASGVNDLVSTLYAARTEAVKRKSFTGPNAAVSVCASTDWNTATPSCASPGDLRDGWITFVDLDGDATVDGGEDIIAAHGPMPDGIELQALDLNDNAVAKQFFSYGPTGFLRQAGGSESIGNVQLCDARGDKDVGGGTAAGRFVLILPTGRPQIYRMREDVQNDTLNPIGGC
jgi:type IV fimbrial biogenesis protein FimT